MTETLARLPSFGDSIRIFETPEAATLAGPLFRESFNADFPIPRNDCGLPIPTPPENWHQYVAIYRWSNGTAETVGFCNFIKYENVYLEGGMCVKSGFYKRLPRAHFRECKASGGVAQMMMRAAETRLTDCDAWFGYCGDSKALAVDLRAGYETTSRQFLIAKWFRRLSPGEQNRLVERIAKIGPF